MLKYIWNTQNRHTLHDTPLGGFAAVYTICTLRIAPTASLHTTANKQNMHILLRVQIGI